MKTESGNQKHEDGFTLIEILVAIAILATAILGIMALFPNSYRQITNSGRISAINHLGQQKIDQLRGTAYGHNDLLAGTHPSTTLGETFPERVTYTFESRNLYESYSIEWFVTDNVPQNDMKTVVVTVGYGTYDSAGISVPASNVLDQYSATFSTYISR